MSWNLLLQLNALVALAGALGISLHWLRAKSLLRLSAGAEMKIQCLLVVACLAFPFIPSPFGGEFKVDPVKKTVVAATYKEFESRYPRSATAEQAAAVLPAEAKQNLWLPVFLFLALMGPSLEILRLGRILTFCIAWKKIGRVQVAFSDQVLSPFSSLWAGQAWVVLPTSLAGNPDHLRIAIKHELQHHRNGDTAWLYLFFFLRALTPFHPLRALWMRAVERSQEEACDESLVDQKRVDRRAYARCLLEVAEISVGGGKRVACAANFFPFSDRNTLKRRIEHMYQVKKTSRLTAWALAFAFTIGLSAAAFASGNWVVDHRVNMAQAEAMAVHARKTAEFPIVVNEAVLRHLNRFLGTEQGRRYVKESLQRMAGYEAILKAKMERYGMPEEILAVGMAESGFQNLPGAENPYSGAAGVWQFIESTARNYGLKVDATVDERLDVEKETDAAFRYLKANKLRFNNWLLGILAYNIGESALQDAIEEHGTRRPWELLRKGLKTDTDYLPKVMAMVLIMKNPDSVR